VDVPDKVLEKRIHLASASEEKQGHLLRGLWASRAIRREGEGAARRWVCLLLVLAIEQSRLFGIEARVC
jgi:hypothetical protein